MLLGLNNSPQIGLTYFRQRAPTGIFQNGLTYLHQGAPIFQNDFTYLRQRAPIFQNDFTYLRQRAPSFQNGFYLYVSKSSYVS